LFDTKKSKQKIVIVLMTVKFDSIKMKKMNWDKTKGTDNQLIKFFINDLQLNSECKKSVKYVENKCQEWAFLKQVLQRKPSLL
jgi:hypothetical protein